MNSLSIRSKMMILVSLITSISLLFVGFINYRAAKDQIVASLQDNANAKVMTRAYNLSAWIENRLAEVEVMSRTEQVRFGTMEERLAYLSKEAERSVGKFNYIGFSDTDGNLTFTSGGTINISDEPGFYGVLKGRSVVSDAFQGKNSNNILFTLQVPVYGEKDVAGLVNVSILVETAFSQHTDFKVGSGDTTLLFTTDGTIIYHPDKSMIGRANIRDTSIQEMVDRIINQRNGYGETTHGDSKQLVFYAAVKGTPWIMVHQVSLQEFEQPLQLLQWKTIVTILVTEAVMLLLITILFNREIKRIREITSVTSIVAEGHFDLSPIPIQNDDEISTLAQSVNGMMAQLKEMFERMEAIINQNDFAIISLDSNYTVNYFSKAAEKLLGYRAEEVLYKATPLLFHDPDQLRELAEQLTRQLGRRVPPDVTVFKELRNIEFSYDRDWDFIRKDGTRVAVSHNSNGLRDRNGQFIGVVAIARDITEQKRVQQELVLAKQEAEEANRAKGVFLARMSHEIRTPLNGIIGLSQLMQRTKLNDVQSDYLRNILSSSQTLLRIINDILDFSKMEAGKFELERVVFHPEDIIQRLSETVSVFLGGKEQFELIMDIPDNIPDGLLGDPLRLEQVLLNLCNNAIKFTRRGQVIVGIRLIEGNLESVKLQFKVQDTGIGIAKEQMDKLFVPFTQADGSTSRKYGGSGLGLVISSYLIDMMGGHLEVESKPGAGTAFWFTVSFARSRQSAIREYKVRDAYAGMQVWVVEDSEVMRDHLCSLLSSYGLEGVPVASWKEAYAKIEQTQRTGSGCVLALLDMEMPDMYGSETWVTFQKAAAEAGMMTLVMTTAFGRDEMMGMPIDYRPDGMIVKPFSRPELFRAIEAVLERRFMAEQGATASEVSIRTGMPIPVEKRILLAEDNAINQQVAFEMLRYRGYYVEVAEDGREALRKLEDGEWDLVLMDIHMPEMDGIEATKRIRSDSRYDGLPIIAMTANVIRDDHEMYLSIGMDDIITKPLEAEPMFATIRKWLGVSGSGHAASEDKPDGGEPILQLEGIDVRKALARLNGRTPILLQMVKTFERDYHDFSIQLRQALEKDNPIEAHRLAHTLKGAAGNLSAAELYVAAGQVESMIKDAEGADLPALERALDELEHILKQLLASIRQLE
ncbi:response regulator [Paenibacillus sp. NPDC056579]|uniref:response regulator n=1 Tax=Paenibacillus sp. NPDC056579 TaxID=3345871 RepID=UPI00368AF204